ncbi:hypothetical protein PsYK624_066450 [Phanerochaete sordida]|uniref:Uncharacterized protein n=1 Tax=Phanerochaete sordida TaxID=48140 RepID=A0A9P3LCR9_9APHY|nr:hypothetical protein PsYK624_066450 [Phanerochaete sordida]
MQLSARFLALAVLIAFASVASSLSIDVSSRDLNVATREVKVFEYTGSTEVMAPRDVELVRRQGWTYRNNQKLVALIIVKNALVLNAACGSGNPINCAIGAGYAALTFFFAVFRLADRTDTSDDTAPYFVYPPTISTPRMVKRFSTELEHGQWHYVGHAQYQGLNHTVHYFTDGGIQRLRARTVPFWNATGAASKRQSDPDNDGGFVADYSWLSNNEGPYDSFHSSPDGTSYFADNLGGYMISNTGIAACAAFKDAQGTLDNGIMTYGWNNQEFQWQDGEEEAVYGECSSDLGL